GVGLASMRFPPERSGSVPKLALDSKPTRGGGWARVKRLLLPGLHDRRQQDFLAFYWTGVDDGDHLVRSQIAGLDLALHEDGLAGTPLNRGNAQFAGPVYFDVIPLPNLPPAPRRLNVNVSFPTFSPFPPATDKGGGSAARPI